MGIVNSAKVIKRKTKECKRCQQMKIIWAHGLCQGCDRIKNSKPIKKVSTSHQVTLDLYAPERKIFLAENPLCQLKLEVCTRNSECVHHMKGKAYRELYLDKNFWMASCIRCNNRVEEIGEKAYELGLKIKSNAKI